ncbi:ferric/cupric-chelate reductase, partial [Gonapodya sp. JEL0774]
MCAMLIGFLLIPTSKNSVVAHYLRIPYTSCLRVHQWTAWALTAFALLHTVLSMAWKSLELVPLVQTFFTIPAGAKWGSEKFRYATALPALACLLLIVVFALEVVRRTRYNLFLWSHLLGIPFIGFAYLHDSIDIYFAVPGLLLYGVDVVMRVSSRFIVLPVASVSHEPSGYKVITVTCDKSALPGQFMRVIVPSVSRLEAHPWSVASCAQGKITFLVGPSKGPKQWTQKVFRYLEESKKGYARVCLQGPFGNPVSFVTEGPFHDAYVFLVAGSGISPAIASIEHLLD